MIKIVFLDQLGCYASLLAAAYRVGKIGSRPSSREILDLPGFAIHRDLSLGNSFYVGEDPAGNQVYTLGTGGEGKLIEVSARDINKILNIRSKVLLIDISGYNSFAVRVCSYLRLVGPLEKVALYGAAIFLKTAMPRISRYVERINQEITME